MKRHLKTIFLCGSAIALFGVANSNAAPFRTNLTYDNFLKAVKSNNYNNVRYSFRPEFINAKDSSGKTPLTYAIKNNNYDITHFLLQNGASTNTLDNDGNPAYCAAENTSNRGIKLMFQGYNFSRCNNSFSFSEAMSGTGKPALITVGTVAAIGGVVALAAGGGGGGGSKSSNVTNSEYGLVGKVDETALLEVLNKPSYGNGLNIGGAFYTNYNDYNEIRLAYSLARGFTGRVGTGTNVPYFMDSVTPSAGTVSGSIKVAVIDSGVQTANTNISSNIITGLNNSNLPYLYCQENPSSSQCTSASYVVNNANPYAYYAGNNATWHGTAVAGLIAGKYGASGINGVAPDASILPYRLSFDNGAFVSNYYIGEAFRSAADNGAIVANNSWGYPTLNDIGMPTINASDITSKNDLLNIFRDTTHGSSYNNFFDQMTYAVTNKDMTFVFTTGNDGTAQPGITTAVPLFFNEFQTADGGYKNFIAVAAYDTDAGSIASYSNRCGVAKQYCITAPGTQMVVPIFPTGDINSSSYKIVNGTSFAAPLVSGAVAVLKGAFPYLNGEDITKLIFVTARDLGASGVDDIYGWGMLDLERATRPVGAEIVPVDSRIDGRGYAMASSSLQLNSVIGNKIKEKNLTMVFVDDFNRTFNVPLNNKIEIIKDRPKPIDMLNRFAENKAKTTTVGNNKALSLYSNSQTIGYNSGVANEFKLSYNANNTNNSNYGFSFYYGNNPYNSVIDNEADFYNNFALSTTSNYNILNPYFRNDSVENYGFNNRFFLNDKLSFNIGMLYQDYTINTQRNKFEGIKNESLGSSMSLISSVNYAVGKNMTSTVELGFMDEKDTLFASKTSGAFGLGDNNQTYFIGVQNNINLYDNKLSLLGKANFGYTSVSSSNDTLISDVSNLYTNSFALGFNYNLLNEKKRKSNVSFIVSQSVKINSGNMNLRLPVARDNDGNIYYNNHKINLKDKGNLEYQLAYSYQTSENNEFNAGLIYSNYSDGYEDKNEGILMLKYRKAF